MPQLPEEKRKQILELFEHGLTNKTEIARRVGVSKPTVYKVLEEEGLYEPDDDTAAIDSEVERPTEEYDETEEYEDEEEDYPEDEGPEPIPTPPNVVAAFLGGLAVGAALVYFGKGLLPSPPFPRPQDR